MTSPRKHFAQLLMGMLMAVILGGIWRPAAAACQPDSGLPVLIVNDNELERKLIFDLVYEAGIPPDRIHQTGNSAEALQMIRRTKYGVAVISNFLNPIPSPQLLREIRGVPGLSALPVLVIVPPPGFDPRRIADAVREAGATGLVFKPVNARELRQKIVGFICR